MIIKKRASKRERPKERQQCHIYDIYLSLSPPRSISTSSDWGDKLTAWIIIVWKLSREMMACSVVPFFDSDWEWRTKEKRSSRWNHDERERTNERNLLASLLMQVRETGKERERERMREAEKDKIFIQWQFDVFQHLSFQSKKQGWVSDFSLRQIDAHLIFIDDRAVGAPNGWDTRSAHYHFLRRRCCCCCSARQWDFISCSFVRSFEYLLELIDG